MTRKVGLRSRLVVGGIGDGRCWYVEKRLDAVAVLDVVLDGWMLWFGVTEGRDVDSQSHLIILVGSAVVGSDEANWY